MDEIIIFRLKLFIRFLDNIDIGEKPCIHKSVYKDILFKNKYVLQKHLRNQPVLGIESFVHSMHE